MFIKKGRPKSLLNKRHYTELDEHNVFMSKTVIGLRFPLHNPEQSHQCDDRVRDC